MTRRSSSHSWLFGALTLVIVVSLAVGGARATTAPTAGSQGVDTALPATASQVTVSGRGTFSGLAVTVNQSRNLSNQAVSVTWTGGTPTVSGPGRFGSQYLQIMQCWGDDDGTVAGNPGPPPEQCEQGAVAGTFGGLPGSLYPAGLALSRVISRSDWPNFSPAIGALDPRTTNVWLPFRAVDGTVVNIQTNPKFNPAIVGGNFWLNPYFNLITTNEIAGGVTGPDGKGAELFQVVTGAESAGLGCGQRSQPVAGGDKKTPQCWLVIVPRGTPSEENLGTPFDVSADQFGVVSSPVSPQAWRNRIAIPLDFNPLDSPCALGADERRISGSELALSAVTSWQPALCAGGILPPYSYAPVSDNAARQQLVSRQPGSPGIVVVSQALPSTSLDPASPLVYAPVTASGLVVGFNIERNPLPDAPTAAQQLAGVRVADLNLTPRLVAKLLTQSYVQAVSIQVVPDYPWVANNPRHMGLDPDFTRFNPEFELLQIADSRTFSGLQLPAGNSDAAAQLWEWVFADPEASAWLAGAADEWGMVVNPSYLTTVANTTGAPFGIPVPRSFPKADPFCFRGAARGVGNSIVPPPLCGTDWLPYKRSLSETAQVTRVAGDGARIVDNPSALSASEVWTRDQPQYLGRRDMLAITDTPSAAQFGLQMAHLSRAGDNGANRAFVAADAATMSAGLASMAPGPEPTVLVASPATPAPGAYPLTMITYAVIEPLSLDAQARSDYAAFLEYVAGPGQVPGYERGQLPRGYVPLPEGLRANTTTAAGIVRTLVATTAAPLTPTTVAAVPSTVAPRRIQTNVTPTAVTVAPNTQVPTTNVVSTSTTTTTTIVSAEQPDPNGTTVLTPVVRLAPSRYAVPGMAILSLVSALGALEVTKRPRRKRPGPPALTIDPTEWVDN